MRIHWTALTDYVGIGFGYSTHQKRLSEALIRNGVDLDPDSEVAVHLTTPDAYNPIPGKYNILYTMYECTTIPDTWAKKIQEADLIVVPCRQNKWLFSRYTDIPVEICTEGVEVDKYKYYRRQFPNPLSKENPFTYLWLGATNPRKGTEHVILAWEMFNKYWFENDNSMREKFRLIMKTTQETDREAEIEVRVVDKFGKIISENKKKEMLPAERIMNICGNAVVDTRRLPVISTGAPDPECPGSLVDLYNSAHCFLLPSRGEGFGLTLAEAMSTGCPNIYTPWGGPRDFCSEKTGYPLRFNFTPVRTVGVNEKGEKYISHETTAANADVKHLMRLMLRVFYDYDTALEKGKRAAETIRKGFTWDISARMLIKIIEKYTKERIAA